MNAQKRKINLLGAFFVAVLVVISFFVSSYLGAFLIEANAQTKKDAQEINVIKIPPPIDVSNNTETQHQTLQESDIRIVTTEGKTLVFRVELARTNEQRQKGLMFRHTIKPGSGMLFLFDDIGERSFWMKNTWIPLDIIFIRKDGIIHNISSETKPYSLEHINSEGDVQHVLEIGGGEAVRLGIAVGDTVLFE